MREDAPRDGHGVPVAVLATSVRAAAVVLAYGGAWWLRFSSGWLPVTGRTDVLPGRYLAGLPVALLACLVAARAAGLRSGAAGLGPPPRATSAVAAALLSTVLVATAVLLARDLFQYSRGFVLLHGALLAVVLPPAEGIAHGVAARWRRRSGRPPRILLVGEAAGCARIAADLAAAPGPRPLVVGRTGSAADAPGAPALLGPAGETARIAREHRADRVLVLDEAIAGPGSADLFRGLADGTADVGLAWTLPRPEGFPPPHVTSLGSFAVAFYWETPLRGSGAGLKRALDVLLAALLVVGLAPVMLILAAVVRVTSPGPVLFRQRRVGLDGREFEMLKFRTMRVDAEAAGGAVYAVPGDPRRTLPGGFLRRFSLDELPQLWNVLRGDMSLVGPRPERPEFVDALRRALPGYMLRHSLRCGMTGWAQVHGLRGRSGMAERLAYDLDYARRWSLLFDIEILARTLGQVIAGRNAY